MLAVAGPPGPTCRICVTHVRSLLRYGFVVFVLAIPLASPACRRDDADADARATARAAVPSPAVPPPSRVAAAPAAAVPSALDLSGDKAEAVFWVLGFFDEYLGRGVLDDSDVIERLYCNEQDKAARLRTMIRRLQREQQLADDLREAVVQECLLWFHSPTLARELNRMYASREPSGMFDTSGGRMREQITLKATRDLFARVGREARLAYLAGAYYRYGQDDGTMRFANAAHKADLIADLLREAGATAVMRETFKGLPHTNIVRFTPSAALKAAFAR
jgi:hypothetical protein